jgi:hypothetical protein
MTPIWLFPAYPLLLTAPFGSSLIAAAIDSHQLASINPVAISLACVAIQGAGFLIGFMVCAAFLYRLMTQKLPRDAQRPGVVRLIPILLDYIFEHLGILKDLV